MADPNNSLSWFILLKVTPKVKICKNFIAPTTVFMDHHETSQQHTKPTRTWVPRLANDLTLTYIVGAEGQSWPWKKLSSTHIKSYIICKGMERAVQQNFNFSNTTPYSVIKFHKITHYIQVKLSSFYSL